MNSCQKSLLLVAYACEEKKGSESAVGWSWLQKYIESSEYKITLLTRSNNVDSLNKSLSEMYPEHSVEIIDFDLSASMLWLKKRFRITSLYYGLWQFFVFFNLFKRYKVRQFNLVHHVTFAGVRFPALYMCFGERSILGPVGGGEELPIKFMRGLCISSLVKELFRKVANRISMLNPLVLISLAMAKEVYVTSTQTRNILPFGFKGKTKIELAISKSTNKLNSNVCTKQYSGENLKIIFAGRHLYWKGGDLLIKMLSELPLSYLQLVEVNIIGQGPETENWKKLSKALRVDHVINWIDWIDQEALYSLFESSDVLVYPSYHDSGALVVLEAMEHSTAVLCLDIGGPAELVGHESEFCIDTSSCTIADIPKILAAKVIAISKDSELLNKHKNNNLGRSKYFTIDRIYTAIVRKGML